MRKLRTAKPIKPVKARKVSPPKQSAKKTEKPEIVKKLEADTKRKVKPYAS